jgi:hypothetical protein
VVRLAQRREGIPKWKPLGEKGVQSVRIFEIKERVLSYREDQLEAWGKGDKSIAPPFFVIPPIYWNQPRYHFAETLVLRRYYDTEGWQGFTCYALGYQYPGSKRRKAGRQKVEEIIPSDRLRRLRALRSDPHLVRSGAGEPDIFLYKHEGQFKFVEVKKGKDRLSAAQLICIAQILDILRCDVDIVYVAKELQLYTPKKYWFDLIQHKGGRVA